MNAEIAAFGAETLDLKRAVSTQLSMRSNFCNWIPSSPHKRSFSLVRRTSRRCLAKFSLAALGRFDLGTCLFEKLSLLCRARLNLHYGASFRLKSRCVVRYSCVVLALPLLLAWK